MRRKAGHRAAVGSLGQILLPGGGGLPSSFVLVPYTRDKKREASGKSVFDGAAEQPRFVDHDDEYKSTLQRAHKGHLTWRGSATSGRSVDASRFGLNHQQSRTRADGCRYIHTLYLGRDELNTKHSISVHSFYHIVHLFCFS